VNCEKCKQAPATVHVTELRALPEEGASGSDAASSDAASVAGQPSAGETGSAKSPSAAGSNKREAPAAKDSAASESAAAKSASAGEASASSRPAPKQPPAKPPSKSAGKSAASKQSASEDASASPYALTHVHLCAGCADKLDLWHSLPVVNNKGVHSIWKLLQSAKAGHAAPELSCPACGMTLAEFRAKGRLGCPNDYEVFRAHLNPLLKRMHNASEHVGRVPGVEPEDLERQKRIHALRAQLDAAVRDEAYEHAARLRDELQQLEPRRES